MMEANKLMIGDWVLLPNGTKGKIIGLWREDVGQEEKVIVSFSYKGNLVRYSDYATWSGRAEDISPIPLTTEILEKNGFKKQELTIGNYALFLKAEGKYDIRSLLWGGVFDGRIDIEVLGNYVCIRKRFNYVHELQHALRLCGLNDLANNIEI